MQYSDLIPKGGFTKQSLHRTTPGDSMQMGTHSSDNVASKHKKMVSAVLHLKKESIGARTHPTAFKQGNRAFNTKVWHG